MDIKPTLAISDSVFKTLNKGVLIIHTALVGQPLNYRHLLTFWTLTRCGSVSQTCERLRLASVTLHYQIHALEQYIGQSLYEPQARGIKLTPMGRKVYCYAEQIFNLSQDLQQELKSLPQLRPSLRIGVRRSFPQQLVYQILAPLLLRELPPRLSLMFKGAKQLEDLFEQSRLDLILSEQPVNTQNKRWSSLRLGDSGISFFASAAQSQLREQFPYSLNRQPLVVPAADSALRPQLDKWLNQYQIKPMILAEVQHDALQQLFGLDPSIVFCAPTVLEEQIKSAKTELIGRAPGLRQAYYVISQERDWPWIEGLIQSAQQHIFAHELKV